MQGGAYFAALARLAALALALASSAVNRLSMAAARRCSCLALMQSRMNDSQTSADNPTAVILGRVLDLDPADVEHPRRRVRHLLAVRRRFSSHSAMLAAL